MFLLCGQCTHVCVSVCMCACPSARESTKSASAVIPQWFPPWWVFFCCCCCLIFFFFLLRQATHWLSLPQVHPKFWLWAPRILLSLPPQYWDYEPAPSRPVFKDGFSGSNTDPCAKQVLYRLSRLPNPRYLGRLTMLVHFLSLETGAWLQTAQLPQRQSAAPWQQQGLSSWLHHNEIPLCFIWWKSHIQNLLCAPPGGSAALIHPTVGTQMNLLHNINWKEHGEDFWAICPSYPRAEPELIYLEHHSLQNLTEAPGATKTTSQRNS